MTTAFRVSVKWNLREKYIYKIVISNTLHFIDESLYFLRLKTGLITKDSRHLMCRIYILQSAAAEVLSIC